MKEKQIKTIEWIKGSAGDRFWFILYVTNALILLLAVWYPIYDWGIGKYIQTLLLLGYFGYAFSKSPMGIFGKRKVRVIPKSQRK